MNVVLLFVGLYNSEVVLLHFELPYKPIIYVSVLIFGFMCVVGKRAELGTP